MTTRLKSILLILAMIAGSAFAAENKTAESVMTTLKAKYPKTTFRSVSETHLPGIYEVVMGKNVAYVEADGRYFIFGHLFDMEKQKDLTEDKVPEQAAATDLPKIDVGSLPLGDAIKTVRGNGDRKLYIFSDPDCPYCKQLENNLIGIDNVTIYTFMFPIESLHPSAKAKSVGVWCAEDRAKAWDDLMLRNVAVSGKCENPVDRNIALAEKFSIRGTPTIILADGTLIPGAVQKNRLIQLLAEAKK